MSFSLLPATVVGVEVPTFEDATATIGRLVRTTTATDMPTVSDPTTTEMVSTCPTIPVLMGTPSAASRQPTKSLSFSEE